MPEAEAQYLILGKLHPAFLVLVASIIIYLAMVEINMTEKDLKFGKLIIKYILYFAAIIGTCLLATIIF